jgi:hypothetical protein
LVATGGRMCGGFCQAKLHKLHGQVDTIVDPTTFNSPPKPAPPMTPRFYSGRKPL